MRRLLLCLACAGLMAGDPWTKTEIGLEAAYQTLLFIDWKQTSSFHTPDNHYFTADGTEKSISERNLLLGSNPKQSTINAVCLISSLAHFAISNHLTHRERIGWQVMTVTVEFLAVNNNYRVGVKIRW